MPRGRSPIFTDVRAMPAFPCKAVFFNRHASLYLALAARVEPGRETGSFAGMQVDTSRCYVLWELRALASMDVV